MAFKIRAATKEDCKEIFRMITELAVFEKMPDQVKISHEELESSGFCENPLFGCLVAEVPEEHKSKEGFTVVGYGLYFYTYSTWRGRALHLEDLYVMPEFRGRGIGISILSKVAEIRKCIVIKNVDGGSLIFLLLRPGNFCPSMDYRIAQGGEKMQCARLQLSVLNWNTPSRDFYAAKGAQDLTATEGWHLIRFDGQSLDNLANDAPKD